MQQIRSISKDPGRHADEDDQQREQREEAVVGDECADPSTVVLAVSLEHGEREGEQPTTPLDAIDPIDDRIDKGGHDGIVAAHPRSHMDNLGTDSYLDGRRWAD